MKNTGPSWRGAAVFSVLLAILLLAIGAIFRPAKAREQNVALSSYQPETMQEEMKPEALVRWQERIMRMGNRFPGSKGHEAARKFLVDFYTELGFEVFELPVPTVVPAVEACQLTAGGIPVPATPILPNFFQPDRTPKGGVTGKLILMTDDALRTEMGFSEAIAVVDVARLPAGLELNAMNYLRLGVKALVVTNGGGPVAWAAWGRLVTALPVSFPRVYADPEILNHLGEQATLDLRVRYESRVVATVVARLSGGAKTAQEAVVAGTHYDSYSLLPWHGAPALQAAGLAQHLAMINGLSRYRDSLSRDVIAIASGAQFNGMSGEAAALQMVGSGLERAGLGAKWNANLVEQKAVLRSLEEGDGELTAMRLKIALERVLYEKTQERIRARAAFEAEETNDLESIAYLRFAAANRVVEKLRTLGGMTAGRLETEHKKELADFGIKDVLHVDLQNLRRYHEEQVAFWQAGARLHAMTARYANLLFFSSLLLPAEKASGRETSTRLYGVVGKSFELAENKQGPFFREVAVAVEARDGKAYDLEVLEPTKETEERFGGLPMVSGLWTEFNHPACLFMNTDRRDAYENLTNPFVPAGDFASMEVSARHAAGYLLGLAHGAGSVRSPGRLYSRSWNFSGRVLVSGVGQSVLPNFPLAGALMSGKLRSETFQRGMGFYPLLLFQANPYGSYEFSYAPVKIFEGPYNLQAFGFDENGIINAAKDEGAGSQKLFRSKDLAFGQDLRNITLVVFPAAGVTLPDLINPQTLAPYSSVTFLQRQGLSAMAKINLFASTEAVTCFLEPDTRFVTTFNAGSPDNELVQRVRAFALGPQEKRGAGEINGEGYIAQENPIMSDAYEQTAVSLLRVNGTRAALQERSHLLDPMTRDYFDASRDLLRDAVDKPWLERLLGTWDSITYSIIVHPVLRDNITEAVASIVWYLCLLLPFVFFMEKLVLGYSDIRCQLAAQAGIFLLSFALLRVLHPAFGMIRSSLVILLGFVIFLICVAITVLFASKASENLEPLRRKQGKVKTAEASPLGIMATAFLLGLNNMHRRKVRTGLTCGTLMLITFAMIAFTSIDQGYEDRETPLGPAAYQGLLVKKEKTAPISEEEITALRTKYGASHTLSVRKAVVGRTSSRRDSIIPNIELFSIDGRGMRQHAKAKTILFFSSDDPVKAQIPMLPESGWVETGTAEPGIVISDRLAETLSISLPLGKEGWPVELNGSAMRIVGVFDSDAMNEVRDLDGQSLLPFDIEALQSYEITGENSSVLAGNDSPRVPAGVAILAPLELAEKENGGTEARATSVVVGLDGSDYREASEVVRQFVEQSGQQVVYGLEGSAWRAVRRRAASAEGMVDLLIPLAIAAMTVLNTMKGSVYERKDELAVYNAVGIAPRYIFMMFFAEALVYAVVGSVLGYFLSQGVGAALTAWNLTGGLNMTFASLNSVYASLAVVAAVFVSTYFPAKTAVQIAAPAEESGWKIPEPEGDRLAFALPFVFDARERLAVLSFFRQYFSDNTEGEGGGFQSSVPRSVRSPVPGVACTVWLKPFDQGVSQELEIVMSPDAETGEYCARVLLRRLSGTLEGWMRLNRAFISQLRRQFLHWRAVDATQKETLFDNTREWFLAEAER